jgi:hypothetical protein
MKSKEFDKQKESKINNPRYAKVLPKTVKKSKHKHDYRDFLIAYQQIGFVDSNTIENRISRMTICVHCGKLNEIHYSEHEKIREPRTYRILTLTEVLEKYKHLIKFDMDTIVKHGFEFHEDGFIPIHSMYQKMIMKYLNHNMEVMYEDIVYGLSNNIQPEEMANIINNKKVED